MSRHLKQWINHAERRRRGGRYVGVVVAVVEEVVRNPCGSNSPGPASPPHGDSGTGSRRTPALDRERAQHRSMADASNSARFHALSAALRSMLEVQIDLWRRGFDADQAAARLLPVLLPLVRE
jgi:hypothetical protein